MKRRVMVLLGMLTLLGMPANAVRAGGHWSVGLNLGFPGYYRPCWGYDYYYYRPYPVYVAPPPVIVQPAPIIQAAPVVQPSYAPPPPAPVTVNAPVSAEGQAEVERNLQQLASADERVRAESAIQLGRLRAHSAIDPLAATLAGDRSPVVRESAARALGLIGSGKAVPALQYAAQSDSDRDVRHSAQFALDVVRTNPN